MMMTLTKRVYGNLGRRVFVAAVMACLVAFFSPSQKASAADAIPPFSMVKLNVTDFERSLKFYTEVLGFKKQAPIELPSVRMMYLTRGGTDFEFTLVLVDLKKKPEPFTLGNAYNNFMMVVPDIAAMKKRITDAGYQVRSAKLDPSPLRYGKSLDLAFVKDPDGFEIELVQINR
jgi:lactoylglutathione lyase